MEGNGDNVESSFSCEGDDMDRVSAAWSSPALKRALDSGLESLSSSTRESTARDSVSTTASLSESDTMVLPRTSMSGSLDETLQTPLKHRPRTRNSGRLYSSAPGINMAGKGSVSFRPVTRNKTDDPKVRAILLDQQMTAVSHFCNVKRVPEDSNRRKNSNDRKIMDSMVVDDDLASSSSCNSLRLTRQNRASVENGTPSVGSDSFLENRSGNGFEVVPLKKFTQMDVIEMDTLAKKRRRVEVCVPNYKKQEPVRFTGMFHPKIVAELQKHMLALARPEKKRVLPNRMAQGEVINLLRNDWNTEDLALLEQIAVYAISHHRKQESFIVIILLLLANGFDANTKNENGDSLLKLAFQTGDQCLIDLLLRYGTSVEDIDADGNSALHEAVRIWISKPGDNWTLVEMVLDTVARDSATVLFAKNKAMRSPLTLCLTDSKAFTSRELEAFVIAFGTQRIEHQAESLVHLLASHQRIDLVIFCLSHYPFNPDRLDSAECKTFIHILAGSATLGGNDAELLTNLIQTVKASVNIADKKGRTALDVARAAGNTDLVSLWSELTDSVAHPKQGVLIRDIAMGKEAFPIRVYNDKSTKRLDDFVYVRQNIYLGDGPRIKGALTCTCRPGQCNTVTCTCLKRGLGYSASGTIVPGTCKGNPIFECGPDCICGPSCSSRVVQRGIKYPLEIFMTAKRGWGVRTPKTVQPGEFICEFVGEIIESDRLLDRDPNNDWAMELTVDNYDGTMFHVDPTTCGNVARYSFLNHSCDPNLFPVRVYQSGDAVDSGVVMAMFSAQVVQKNHELTFHYGDAYWERQIERGVFCSCGTSKCKFGDKRSKSSKKRARARED